MTLFRPFTQWSNSVWYVTTLTLLQEFQYTSNYTNALNIPYILILYWCIIFFSFPADAVRRRLWVQFVENLGIHVNRTSKLCSRHFILGVDFLQGGIRRRLTSTAVPSIVSLLYEIGIILVVTCNCTVHLHAHLQRQ